MPKHHMLFLNFVLFMFSLNYKESLLSQNLDELVTLKKCQCCIKASNSVSSQCIIYLK